jgi:hypothetical protein
MNIDRRMIPLMNTYLRWLTDRIHVNHQTYTSTYEQNTQIRHESFQCYRLQHDDDRRQLNLINNELNRMKTTYQSCRMTIDRSQRSAQFYKYLFDIDTSFAHNIDYVEQWQQSTDILSCLIDDVRQCENEIQHWKNELEQQITTMRFFSINLCQIRFEQDTVRSAIEQLKHDIAFEMRVYNTLKDVMPTSFTLPLAMSTTVRLPSVTCWMNSARLDRSTSNNDTAMLVEQRLVNSRQERVSIDQLCQQRRVLADRETCLTRQLSNLKQSNEQQLNMCRTTTNNLTAQIDRMQISLHVMSIDFLPLQFELFIYRTLLDMNPMDSFAVVEQNSSACSTNVIQLIEQCQQRTSSKQGKRT